MTKSKLQSFMKDGALTDIGFDKFDHLTKASKLIAWMRVSAHMLNEAKFRSSLLMMIDDFVKDRGIDMSESIALERFLVKLPKDKLREIFGAVSLESFAEDLEEFSAITERADAVSKSSLRIVKE